MPEWLAIYDVLDMAEMEREPYLRLRKDDVKSEREKDTMKQINIGRKLLDFVMAREAEAYEHQEKLGVGSEGNVLVVVNLNLQPGKKEELEKWYSEEHIPMLSKVPGWLRTRVFKSSSVDTRDQVEYYALHEYTPENGLGGEEHQASTSTPWSKEIFKSAAQRSGRRVFNLYYTFGPGPRDLTGLSSKDVAPFTSPDRRTQTFPASRHCGAAIESFVTTRDGVVLPYRLEGCSQPDAPLIVLSNSILVDWKIWDGFVAAFSSLPQNRTYRILRYLTRGRSSQCGDKPITIDVLASDIVELLDALRVPKAAAVIGVSLGGATVLNAGLKYPDRVAALLACDTSAKSPEGNKQTWATRIAVAEKDGAEGPTGEKVVGGELAELTVRRWFVQKSYDGGSTEALIGAVQNMVMTNSLDGFKKSVEALFEYDLRAEMKGCAVKGAFVVGSGDGKLPGVMKEMAAEFGHGAEYMVIDGAGHLPMVEQAQEFANVVTKFMTGPC